MIEHNITTILFDLDGTVADTNAVILRAMTETLAYMTGETWSPAELLPYWGLLLRDQLARICPDDIDLEKAACYYRGRYEAYLPDLIGEFPGVRELLETLRGHDYRLGIVTSKKRQGALQTLDCLGYTPLFDLLVAEEDTIRHKPAPEPILYALAQLGLAAECAVYIGDNPDDILAARAAGVPAIAVGWSLRLPEELQAAGASALLATPRDLLDWLGHPALV